MSARRAIAATLLLIAATAPLDADGTERFAIVVGNNLPWKEPSYEPLQYADDDALRFAELFSRVGARVTLLATPDEDTLQRLGHLPALPSHRPPTRRNLETALAELERSLAAAEGATEVYFYFSGHGSMSAANAHLHLLDGPFTRIDLHRELLARIVADRMHVIIDSCHAYFLVNPRGARIPVTDRDELALDRHPTVGFLLSTSGRKEVHEWSGYRAGVFSYQLLGALMGAADVGGDGIVAYEEAHAYLAAANADVADPAARIDPYVRYPAVPARPLVDLRGEPPGRCVEVPAEVSGHLHLVDAQGNRVLDAHKDARFPLRLSLPPASRVWMSVGEDLYEADCRAQATARFAVRRDVEAPDRLAPRGSPLDEFRHRLFLRPLTPEYVAGFGAGLQSHGSRVVTVPRAREPWIRDPVTLTLLGTGAAAAATGVVATGLFVHYRERANRRPVNAGTLAAADRADATAIVMTAGLAAGAALLGAWALRAFLPDAPGDGAGPAVAFGGPGDAGGITLSAGWP